jgi:ribA/ribD-fused uncharacterized protein
LSDFLIDSFSGQYRFLSNFWYVEVEFEGITYPTTEHAYQAAKNLDEDYRLEIKYCGKPTIAKMLGKNVVLRDDWEDVKVSIMRDLLRQKFRRPDLAAALLETGDAGLVEGNYWGDVFWGVCKGKGHNWLGRLLMEIREELKNGTR